MDLASIEERLVAGENLKVKYRYPVETRGYSRRPQYGVRSDKLLDVSVELKRFYTKFRGESPIWLHAKEVLEVTPDDGVYEDFAPE